MPDRAAAPATLARGSGSGTGAGPQPIGKTGLPVRALSFGGGGFDTVMQLGVTHALLVIQGKAPEVIVGESAGAINAVAAADVLQAGDHLEVGVGQPWSTLTPEAQQELQRARVHARADRFRHVLDTYLRAKRELSEAFLPDTSQVDAARPLEPALLPMHDAAERSERKDANRAKAGLINLYNELLGIDLTFGTLTRGLRRWLGLRATPEIQDGEARRLAQAIEWLRTWMLIGSNLPRLAPLVATGVAALRPPERPADATAGALIFRPRILRRTAGQLRRLLWTFFLIIMWTELTVLALALPYVLAKGVGELIALGVALFADPLTTKRFAFGVQRWIGPVALALYALAGLWVASTALRERVWKEVRDFNRVSGPRLALEILLESLGVAGYFLGWLVAAGALGMLASGVANLAIEGLGGTPPWSAVLQFWLFKLPGVLEEGFWRLLLLVALVLGVILTWQPWRGYLRRLLERYDLADGLLHPYPLRAQLISLFDPDYYGGSNINAIAESVFKDVEAPAGGAKPKRVGDFADPALHHPAIHVGLTVADVQSGELKVVPPTVTVVDGLDAAVAVAPLFRAKRLPVEGCQDRLFVDGLNVANEPTRALMDFVRHRLTPDAHALHVFAVASLPFSRQTLGVGEDEEVTGGYLDLTKVVPRAMELQRFRDATLERRLTHLFTRAIEHTGQPAAARYDTAGSMYVRAFVVPIEPVMPLRLNQRLLDADTKDKERDLVLEAVADGCRATLELATHLAIKPSGAIGTTIPCRTAVRQHLTLRLSEASARFPEDLPGSDQDSGPGIAEVCRACVIRRLRSQNGARVQGAVTQALEIRAAGISWPHEREIEPEAQIDPLAAAGMRDEKARRLSLEEQGEAATAKAAAARGIADDKQYEQRRRRHLTRLHEAVERGEIAWPRQRPAVPRPDPDPFQRGRPLVNLLFSGGVFRGVYQVGVLNALSETELIPDLVAGASVGSITSAMATTAFGAGDLQARRARIAALAATYLALDRLVLTDRFADFVRNLTLRAASCGFSLRQADRVFRRYDSSRAGRFSREVRLVAAGIERLLYLGPYRLNEFVQAWREGTRQDILERLEGIVQVMLDRSGVGNQILGAEPLETLILHHVIAPLQEAGLVAEAAAPFDVYLRKGTVFLATATNLTRGRLEILGEQQGSEPGYDAALVGGLLASSAFPAVFRPRWSWEVFPGARNRDQYIDGGTMDNMPLDAVAQYLYEAAKVGLLTPRPRRASGTGVPHLVFSASLEVDPPREVDIEALACDWPTLFKRVRKLSYNKKLEIFSGAQRAVRDILDHAGAAARSTLLDLEVVTVKPRWLCGTFAFHPMLGFRREKQARSIAHGCATTLLALARVRSEWADAWGIAFGTKRGGLPGESDPIEPQKFPAEDGRCWIRPGVPCPFSPKALESYQNLGERTRAQLARIHTACLDPATHRGDP